MTVLLAYNPEVERYRFNEAHPLRPERFSLAVGLMDAWGLTVEGTGRGDVAVRVAPPAASDEEILLVHAREYVAFVKRASDAPQDAIGRGIGPGDTPAFTDMHRAAALAVGATVAGVEHVLACRARSVLCPAGGLHHAHADHASGFCIYNDCAVAIERATREHDGLRVAYVDIDAHHGDGVEAAFRARPDVLTLSVHESGRYLFPGTGRATDIGEGAGRGATLNVPLPPYADPHCYELVATQVIEPAVRRYRPDFLVIQAGGDSHRGDPLTHLYQSVAGYCRLLDRILDLAEDTTSGRVVVTGGGGYLPFSEVPRMWASALALMLRREVPAQLPERWLQQARAAARSAGQTPSATVRTFDEELPELDEERRTLALQATKHAIAQVRSASPLLEGD